MSWFILLVWLLVAFTIFSSGDLMCLGIRIKPLLQGQFISGDRTHFKINSLFSFSRQKQKDVNIHRLLLSLSCRLYHVHFYYFFCFCYRHNHHRRHETFPPCYLVIINIITIMIVTVITAFLKTLFFPCEKFFVLFLTYEANISWVILLISS